MSYQGIIEQNGVPLNGMVDMSFTYFDAPTGGDNVGSNFMPNIPVTNGRVDAEMAYFEDTFDGSPRWVEIAVGPPGGTLTPLSPRRAINEAPMATLADRTIGALNDRMTLERLSIMEPEVFASGGATPGSVISNAAPIVETFSLPNGPIFTDDMELFLALWITHPYISDVTVELTSPEGTTITLFSALGGSGDNLTAEYLSAGTVAINGEAPFNLAAWDAQFGSLNDFRGENTAGTWTLTITDSFGADDGTFDACFFGFQTVPGVVSSDGAINTLPFTDAFGRTTLYRELIVPGEIKGLGGIQTFNGMTLNEGPLYLREAGNIELALTYLPDLGGPVLTSPPSGVGVLGPVIGGELTAALLWNELAWVGVAGGFPDINPFIVGQAGDTSNGNGAHVTTGGTWTNGSSRTWKENFRELDTVDILNRLVALPITRWDYTGSEEGSHIGPVAEDFHAAFGTGDNEKYISTVDADGVAFAAIQALNSKLESARAENAELRDQNAELELRLERLERLMGVAAPE